MKTKVVGKHIKHSANVELQAHVARETSFLVKANTPFVSAVKQIRRILDKFNKAVASSRKFQGGEYKKVQYVAVRGMGRAIEKTVSIALKFQEDLDYKVDITTGTREVLDEFQPLDDVKGSVEDTEYQRRQVSYVEVHIWLKRE